MPEGKTWLNKTAVALNARARQIDRRLQGTHRMLRAPLDVKRARQPCWRSGTFIFLRAGW